MGRENLGKLIREFFRDVFGSRLAARLDEELMRTREDCDQRIVEYQHQQAQYRMEIEQLKAKIEKYEMVLLPMVYGNLGGKKQPTFEPVIEPDPDSWAAIRARHEKQQREEAELEKLASKSQ
jgi:hypothetical protein